MKTLRLTCDEISDVFISSLNRKYPSIILLKR